jgi:two-component system, NarL family, sensor histidine kinase DegS
MALQVNDGQEEDIEARFDKELQAEYDQAQRTLSEVSLMLAQSQAELAKLTQRNTAINSQLQQVQAQFESIPRGDIKTAYAAALDAQQRLLVMRGQLEKLTGDEEHLRKYVTLCEHMKEIMGSASRPVGGSASKRVSGGSASLEMTINAQEAERQRLSRQMHDGPAQTLSNFIVQTEIAARMLDIDPMRAKEEMANLKTAAMNTFKEVRTFIFELRPMMLDDLGLFPTIKRYVESFKEQTGCDVNVSIKGSERRLQSFLEVMIFRALQELIGNAYRHNMENAGKIQVNVTVVLDDNLCRLSVSDNGKGFDPVTSATSSGRLGLKIIRERVEMLGGYMEIDSGVGRGARIAFQVPALETQQ